ncbi:hypothetical protein KAU19_03845 [Candidatus Parcubacteria bacterium]|nr:hypothetical protein [Candidatus Parcubacteria bacterium]
MPNIEMYGLRHQEARKKENEIDELLRLKPYANDYVVTNISSIVLDKHAQRQPFLRLVSTRNDHIDNILKELQKLDMDIEVMILDKFIPKK